MMSELRLLSNGTHNPHQPLRINIILVDTINILSTHLILKRLVVLIGIQYETMQSQSYSHLNGFSFIRLLDDFCKTLFCDSRNIPVLFLHVQIFCFRVPFHPGKLLQRVRLTRSYSFNYCHWQSSYPFKQ